MQRHYSLASVLAARHQPKTKPNHNNNNNNNKNTYKALHELTFGCTVVPPPVEAATDAFSAHVHRLLSLFSNFDAEQKTDKESEKETQLCQNSLLNITIASYSPYFAHSLEEKEKKNNNNNAKLSATQFAAQHIPKWFCEHYQKMIDNNNNNNNSYYLSTALAITGTRDTHCIMTGDDRKNNDNNNNAVNSIRGATQKGLEKVVEHFVSSSSSNNKHIKLTRSFLCMRGEDQSYTLQTLLSKNNNNTLCTQKVNPYIDFQDGRDVLRGTRMYIEKKQKEENNNNNNNNMWEEVSLMCADYPQGFFLQFCDNNTKNEIKCEFQQQSYVFDTPLQFFEFFTMQYRKVFYEGHNGALPSVEAFGQRNNNQKKMNKEEIVQTAKQLLQRIELLLLFSDVTTHLKKQKRNQKQKQNDLDLGVKIKEGASVVITQAVPDWQTFLNYYNNVVRTQSQQQQQNENENNKNNNKVFFSIGVMPPLPPFDYVRSLLQLKINVNDEEEENATTTTNEKEHMTVRNALLLFHKQMETAIAEFASSSPAGETETEDTLKFLQTVQKYETLFIEHIQLCIQQLLLYCSAYNNNSNNNNNALQCVRHVSFFTFSYSSSIYLEQLFQKLIRLRNNEEEKNNNDNNTENELPKKRCAL